MSVLIDIESIPMEKREKMVEDLTVTTTTKEGKKQYGEHKSFQTFDIVEDTYVTVPFGYYYHFLSNYPRRVFNYEKMTAKFSIDLFDRQKNIKPEVIGNLNDSQSTVLSLSTGWGKTMFSIYLACKIGLKTIIFYHRIIIGDQWKKSIIKACGEDTKIQMLTSKTKIDPTCDFYIINVINVMKRGRMDFCNIGTGLIDECHTICSEKFSKSMNWIFPKFVIGCSATPIRSDGLDRILELYCGTNITYRPLWALFNVYLYPTGFSPKTKKSSAGTLDWHSVLESQSSNDKRNTIIVNICRYFRTRSILILCKLKTHVYRLVKGLKHYNEDVDCYMGSQKIVNYDCRILVGTYSKCSVGFDHPKLDMLIVVGDCEEGWIQALGRIFRKEYHIPIVIELVDTFRPLVKHMETRIDVCKRSGGYVKNLTNCFPEFEQHFPLVINPDIFAIENENESEEE